MEKIFLDTLDTIADLARVGATCFAEEKLNSSSGFESLLDEAVYLALYTLKLPPETDSFWLSTRLLPREKKKIWDLYQRRIKERVPAAYLTHEAWFCGYKFYVNPDVLIPRSPIAELIQEQFSSLYDTDREIESILDLCTGSGCIGIACAHAFPEARVDLVDVSSEALKIARYNIEDHHVEENVRIIQSDLFSNLPETKYDLIISNPPYVDQRDMARLSQELLQEPQLGLAAGEDGLDLVIPILKTAKFYLKKDGWLVVEVGNSAHALMTKYPDVPFLWFDFENGGEGVLALSYDQLEFYF